VSQRELSLVELAAQNVGVRQAGVALGYMATWCYALHKLGRSEITADEYAEVWRCSRSQAFRRQASIRKALPGVDPGAVVDAFLVQYRARQKRRDLDEIDRLESLAQDIALLPVGFV
jgi:hypothetical protein